MTKPVLSLEEALGLISDIARHGEGADRLRALKEIRVMAQETGSVTLPDPMSDAEVIERIARLLKSAGPTTAQLAYKKAFPHSQKSVVTATPKVTAGALEIDRDKLPKTLKQLYRKFPEVKRPGFPPGYPRGQGLMAAKRWCEETAIKLLIDREQQRVDAAAREAMDAKPEATDELAG